MYSSGNIDLGNWVHLFESRCIFRKVIHYWRSVQFRIHLWISSVSKESRPTGVRLRCLNSANFPENLQHSGWWWQNWNHAFVTHTDTRFMSCKSQDCWRKSLCSKRFPSLWAGEEICRSGVQRSDVSVIPGEATENINVFGFVQRWN